MDDDDNTTDRTDKDTKCNQGRCGRVNTSTFQLIF